MTKKGVFEIPNTKLLLLVSCNMYSSVHMLQPAVSHASFEIIHEVISKIPVGLQGENASKVFFVRRKITVTLSISDFSPWFFAQILENRRGRLSGPFYGPRGNFPKSYHENQYYSIVHIWKFECHRPEPDPNLRNIISRIQHAGSLIQKILAELSSACQCRRNPGLKKVVRLD